MLTETQQRAPDGYLIVKIVDGREVPYMWYPSHEEDTAIFVSQSLQNTADLLNQQGVELVLRRYCLFVPAE